MLSQEDKDFFLKLHQSDITKNFIEKYFAKRYNTETKKIEEPKFKFTDTFSLKANEYNNSKPIEKTNLGLFIFNKFIIENLLEKVTEYWNEPITKKVLGKFENKISDGLLNDVITVDDFAEYENRMQWILAIHTMTCGSFTEKTIKPLNSVINKRDKLLKENKEALDAGDAVCGVQIESELLKDAREELKNDPGMELFNSGARGNFDNHYKCNNVMRGPVFDRIKGRYVINPRSFHEGLRIENFPEAASGVVEGQYPKSVGTAVGGYTVKRYYAEYQSLQLAPKGSDCHSLKTLELYITEKNYNDFLFRYILEGKKLVRLDHNNIKSYIDKKVNLRSPLFCTSDHICNICFGDLPYMMGIKNIGLTTAKVGSNFVNLGMKSFHDSSLKLTEINENNILV